MPVSVTRRQTRTVVGGQTSTQSAAYQVLDECTAAVGIGTEVYVYRVADNSFSHVARAADMMMYGTDLQAARTAGQAFYRKNSVTRDFQSVAVANSFASDLTSRIKYLCVEFDAVLNNFLGDGIPDIIVTSSDE